MKMCNLKMLLPGMILGLSLLAAVPVSADITNSGSTPPPIKISKLSSANDVAADSLNSDDSGKVYDFKDSKTSGVVTVTKTWDDSISNDDRSVPDVSISTAKPGKSPLGYTITYHGNGLTFTDGTTENEIIVNSSGKIISGQYKEISTPSGWFSDSNCINKIEIDSNGFPISGVTSDMDLYARSKTFILKQSVGFNNGTSFNSRIPTTATSIVFTDETMPASAEAIDVDEDGDGGVVAWMNGTTMKVSTQIKGLKVQANPDSGNMFYNKSNLKNIDLTMLDTQNTTKMYGMFYGCSGLINLDLTPLDTSMVTDMRRMFYGCKGLINLDLSSMNTSNLQLATGMFCRCSSLTSLDLSMLDFQNVSQISDVENGGWDYGAMFQECKALKTLTLPQFTNKITNYSYLFEECSKLESLDLSSIDSSNVTDMSSMFYKCRGLTTLDLSSMDTRNVTNMSSMFLGCSGLTVLSLSDTRNVKDMRVMFCGCNKLTALDLTPLSTSNVTDMYGMFEDCGGLTSLDLTPLDTTNVTNMKRMFSGCYNLTSLNLSSLNTSNVTSMDSMFYSCYELTSLSIGDKFAFVGSDYQLHSGTWYASNGTAYTSNGTTCTIPNNKADTYTRR